ncbi:MAG: leucine--tRNA ligase [Verrucomicrobia bacterium]|nr:MAG: leucine--tRNA ligase [Verrucomicrobiota bacterium]
MDTQTHDYEFTKIEPNWQKYWDDHKTFRAVVDPGKPKFYVLDMFPYPSGKGLHVGHPLGFVATDIFARFKRMKGFSVMHTMGFDAFGLPAEQFAIENGVHPSVSTDRNIDNMRRQLYRIGLGHDKERSISTTDTGYYKWTQWIFLKLFSSTFDPRRQKTRPLDELRNDLEAGRYGFDPETLELQTDPTPEAVSTWKDASESERRRLLDGQRLAYMAEIPVNWCPALGTVLANEEVTSEGRSERGNHPVFKRPLKQWMLRITTYTERLLSDLDRVDWPEAIKLMQRNWIGRSEGAEIVFQLESIPGETLRVFTTRPDTLFGATYMVLAPEHPLVNQLTTDAQQTAVDTYIRTAANKSELERTDLAKEKTGIFTGAFAINPVNDARIPIWVADYVLLSYGTGAIMAVPAHDERDHEFATRFEIPIVRVIEPGNDGNDSPNDELPYVGEGTMVNSGNYSGLSSTEGGRKLTADLKERGCGNPSVQYKLRDWLFSRQRYWGEPFPILHGPNGEIEPVDEADLPVSLPPIDDFSPRSYDDPDLEPQPPLSRASEDWKTVERNGVVYSRELNTMPQWAGSCWYYLRYLDPENGDTFCDAETERYWMQPNGVDLYVGGAEHAVLHLLYARFWHKVLFDLGHVSTPEPFGKLFNQGMIQAAAYTDERGVYVSSEEIEERDGRFLHEGNEVTREFGKMGKSLKNSVSPDEICESYGADTLRLYLMFLGPLEAMKPWSSHGIEGVHRFLKRVWKEFIGRDGQAAGKLRDNLTDDDETTRLVHQSIRKVTDDMEGLRFNTSISQLMILLNHIQKLDTLSMETARIFVRLLAPLAPHLAEELWCRLGGSPSIFTQEWPTFDPKILVQDKVKVIFQVNGKLRGEALVARDAEQATVEDLARSHPRLSPHLEGRTVRKVIYVPGRILNFVVS